MEENLEFRSSATVVAVITARPEEAGDGHREGADTAGEGFREDRCGARDVQRARSGT